MRHFVLPVATALVLGYAMATAQAAPPTVTPSPGYDRRLEESRRLAIAPSDWRGQRPVRRSWKYKRHR